MKTDIRWQEKVNRPFELVFETLRHGAKKIVQNANADAANCPDDGDVEAKLHSKVAGVDFSRNVVIEIGEPLPSDDDTPQSLMFELEWKSVDASFLFPIMKAKLHVVPVANGAQLDFRGEYEPPMGMLGHAIDTVVGVRVAESSVENFVSDIASQLEEIIPADADEITASS